MVLNINVVLPDFWDPDCQGLLNLMSSYMSHIDAWMDTIIPTPRNPNLELSQAGQRRNRIPASMGANMINLGNVSRASTI